jgi:SAM-dependent methyltransferase
LSRFPEEKICLIQADSCNLPFRTGFQFDRVISIEVISHIPGSEARKKALHEIYEYISKNGVFLLTVSNDYLIHKVMRKIRGIPREQLISGGKGVGYINKFQKRELMELLDNLFIVERCYGCQSSLGLISRISKKWSYSVEKLIQNSPLSLIMGKMIFVSCKRR